MAAAKKQTAKKSAAKKAPARKRKPKGGIDSSIFPAGTNVTIHESAAETPIEDRKPFSKPVGKAKATELGAIGFDLPAGQYVIIGEVDGHFKHVHVAVNEKE